MSLDLSGSDGAVSSHAVTIDVDATHPLMNLAKILPWAALVSLVLADLKRTTPKGAWWMGRKLLVRVHLAAYLLQKIDNLTDRQVEYGLKDNAAYQLFSGKGVVSGWRPPDHTKVEEFRSRLSPETHRALANETARAAVSLGFADPRETDFDSTVQEANIAYPADANLMAKLAGLGRKVIDYLRTKTRGLVPPGIGVDMRAVKEMARSYFFLAKNAAIDKRREVFKALHGLVKQQMRPVVDICSNLSPQRLGAMPWNIRRAAKQVTDYAWRYLLDVGHFTRKHTMKVGKILSFHAHKVACIKKGKIGKDKEFGRVFQLGRIKGNFLFVLESTSLKMADRSSFTPLLEEHALIFGEGALQSAAADKGYWSASNQRELLRRGVKETGLQPPVNIKRNSTLASAEVQQKLRDRRAGIEALIGRAKHGGQLGKSRMKSDAATLAAGYASVLGFNLRQLVRSQRPGTRRVA